VLGELVKAPDGLDRELASSDVYVPRHAASFPQLPYIISVLCT